MLILNYRLLLLLLPLIMYTLQTIIVACHNFSNKVHVEFDQYKMLSALGATLPQKLST
jgi:hypothetical protein